MLESVKFPETQNAEAQAKFAAWPRPKSKRSTPAYFVTCISFQLIILTFETLLRFA